MTARLPALALLLLSAAASAQIVREEVPPPPVIAETPGDEPEVTIRNRGMGDLLRTDDMHLRRCQPWRTQHKQQQPKYRLHTPLPPDSIVANVRDPPLRVCDPLPVQTSGPGGLLIFSTTPCSLVLLLMALMHNTIV